MSLAFAERIQVEQGPLIRVSGHDSGNTFLIVESQRFESSVILNSDELRRLSDAMHRAANAVDKAVADALGVPA